MHIFVKLEAIDTVIGDEVTRLRQHFDEQVEKIYRSGKLVAGGVFTDSRGGYFVFDVDSAEEYFDLLGPSIIDNCRMESHPVMVFRPSKEYLRTHLRASARPLKRPPRRR